MKKKENYELLCTKLSSFGIKPLTNWVARKEREWHRDKARHLEEITGKSTEEMEKAIRRRADEQIQTVSCLIRNYPYRFTDKWYEDNRRHRVGLGSEPIAQLKRKLTSLGLTPDDWPALAPHDQLLGHLSKPAIMNVPLVEIFLDGHYRRNYMRTYLDCTDEEVEKKTIGDFIKVNPLALQCELGSEGYNRWSFFREHKRMFIALRQQLVKKGFSARDGTFFLWDPEKPSLDKARAVLKKHKLTPSQLRRFAKIVVAERWVI